ncbi:MAG TPA: HlyD family efflux transporter periplasmic adaptor subunit, partial [Mycobacteriales bacterium]|nr:HlyD family efflux transporter periplasmic adaptor subunit [Mycobacteriales bacterium]
DVDATRLIAPIAGVITAVNVSPGLPPPSGAAFTERSVTLVVVASIAEQDVTKLVPGQQARCSFPALGTSVAATLTSLPTAASSASGSSAAVTFPVSLAIAHPPANLLSGMSAQISITIARRPNALEVPTSAVQGASTTPTVQVLVRGKLTSRPVEIGLATESFTEILAGLQVGDIVVTGVVNPASTTTGGGLGGGGLGGGGRFRTFRGARGGAGGG